MEGVDTEDTGTPTTLATPGTPGAQGAQGIDSSGITEPSSSPAGQTMMADLIRMVEEYQDQNYGTSFRVRSDEEYQLAQVMVKHGKDLVKAMEGYSVTNIKISADKQKTATMAKDVIQVMAAMAGTGVVATEGLAAGKIHTGPEWLVPGPNDTTTILVGCTKQTHRVAQRTQVTTRGGTRMAVWSVWNPRTTNAVALAEPATLIDESSPDINRITPEGQADLVSTAIKHGAADVQVSLSGRGITWGDDKEKRTSIMGKLWATQEAINALEAHGLTNRRLDKGLYIFTDKRAAYEYVKENEKPIPTQRRNVARMRDEIDPNYARVGIKWKAAVNDPERASTEWINQLGLQGVHIVGVKGQEVMVKVPRECYRNLIGARKPTGAVYKKTIQPTATTKDLEGAVAELQHMEQMERAAAEISNSKIEAAVEDAAVQLAIQQAAEQLAKSTYEEQRGPLMAAMESRVQQAALMHNAKRAATEVGGKEPGAKRGPGAT